MDIGSEILSKIITYSKYAKYLEKECRRETWNEIVDRYEEMMLKKYPKLAPSIKLGIPLIRDKKVLPSMRMLQFAGIAAEVNNARIYNCSFMPIDSVYSFSETMFLSLGGSGVGYSVQKQHVAKLPPIVGGERKSKRWLIEDTIAGWADAVKVLMKCYLVGGFHPKFDFRAIRPKGTRLITAGGKAPGPEPLKICLAHIEAILERKKAGEHLSPLECHDILCHIANAVLAGGIRRSSLLALFSKDDEEMLTCKFGNWAELNEQRGRCNNSCVLDRNTTTEEEFKHLWKRIEASGSGEPGILWTWDTELGVNPCCFAGDSKILTHEGYKPIKECVGDNTLFINKNGKTVTGEVWSVGVREVVEITLSNNVKFRCTPDHRFMSACGTTVEAINLYEQFLQPFTSIDNPCCTEAPRVVSVEKLEDKEEVFDFSLNDEEHWGVVEGVIAHNCEISLRPYSFCNLCEINVSNITSQADLEERVSTAAMFGTLQAGFTDFYYLRDVWKTTTEEDALLGIGMTGIASGEINKYDLKKAANTAIVVNKTVSEMIGINQAARVTCVKPAGTTSILLGCSSGIHAWHNDFYLRTIRFGKNEPIAIYLMTYHPELCEDDFLRPKDTICVRIPIKAPDGAILRTESPINLLERIKKFSLEWIKPGHISGVNTNNVSATISIDKEWEEVGQWMWDNREVYNGLSVFPYFGSNFTQAPFENITEEQYNKRVVTLKDIDLTLVYESDDNVDFGQIPACAGGACEII